MGLVPMIAVSRKAMSLVGSSRRSHWTLVLLLGVVLSIMEAAGAYPIYLPLETITYPSVPVSARLVNDLSRFLPFGGHSTLVPYLSGGAAAFFVFRSTSRNMFAVAHRIAMVQAPDRTLLIRDSRIADSGAYGKSMTRRSLYRSLEQ